MTSLPQIVALRTDFDNRFVALVTDGSRKNFLEMSSEDEIVVNPKAKFNVESSTTDGMVHIRSSYNNKYWCRGESPNADSIAATAVEPVEDKLAWNCTLFKLHFYGQNVSFYHVGSNSELYVSEAGIPLLMDVTKSSSRTGSIDIFTVVDLSSIVVLPKLVTFTNFTNNRYLRAKWLEDHEYNQFSGEDDMEVVTNYKIFVTSTGEIRVMSVHYGKYWRRSPNWIWSDSTDTSAKNPDTLFEVFKIDDNVIALRNGGNKRFCKRLTTEGKSDCLNAAASSMEVETRLIVKEPVVSRKIEVQFRLEDARIYDKTPITAASVTIPNKTNVAHEVVQGVTYTKTQVSTWSNTITVTLGTKAEFKTGVPFLAEGKFEVSAEISNAVQFGQSNDFSKEVKTEYKVPVPPMTNVTIKVLGTEAKYDIPFSYVQTDVYATGETVTTTFHDGVYNAVESYDFIYEATYDPL